MNLTEIWNSYPVATKKQEATAARIVEDLKAKVVRAELRRKGLRVSVWRDLEYEKRLIVDYVNGLRTD